MQSIAKQILNEIARHKDNWCFSQKDFMGCASRDALDKAFSRLVQEGKIRRVGRGLYDVLRYSDLLKSVLSPSSDQIARAVARKHGWRIQPTGAGAANMLNLSTQVPMKIIYLSDGPTKSMDFGGRTIRFKNTAPKNMAASELSGLVINAFNYLGKRNVTPEIVAKLRDRFNASQKKQLLKDARFATDWIFEAVQEICGEDGSDG